VLTVCHVFSGDLWAGAEAVIFNLLSSLTQDAGLQVVALALNEGLPTARLRKAGITTYVVPETRHSLPGIVHRAASLLKGHRVAILHSHRYKENVLAWLLARRLGIPELVTTVHGLPEAPGNRGDEVQAAGWKRRLDYFVVRNAFSAAVAVSDEMKRTLVGRYGFPEQLVRVIHNGSRFPGVTASTTTRHGVFHVGSVGRLVPIKGFELFLEVAAAVRRQIPAVRFSILGDGSLREELKRRAAVLGLADCLEFVAPREDPGEYYRSLDLYLATSVHEGLPLSIVEAMGWGKPIVSAAVGGIPEIVRHGEQGFLVEGRDPERFARWCVALMRDDGLRYAMGERAQAWARARLSTEAMASAYRRLYAECESRIRRHCAVTRSDGVVPEPRVGRIPR
jgi:glycosyltransferase involved in cell wall biosynthesis